MNERRQFRRVGCVTKNREFARGVERSWFVHYVPNTRVCPSCGVRLRECVCECEDTHRDALVVQRIRSQNHACSSPAQSPARFPQHHRADLALAPRYRITLRRRMTCVRSQASGAREPRSALRFWYALATEWCGERCGGPQGRTD